jgi:hypothetical protein
MPVAFLIFFFLLHIKEKERKYFCRYSTLVFLHKTTEKNVYVFQANLHPRGCQAKPSNTNHVGFEDGGLCL